MDADHGVIAALPDLRQEFFYAGGQKLVQGRPLRIGARVALGAVIAGAEEPGHFPIHEHVAAGDQLGHLRGQVGQGIPDLAGDSPGGIDRLQGLGAGVVALARVGAENQDGHDWALLSPVVWAVRASRS